MLTAVGIVMETMVSTSASYLRIKLAFKPTRKSGKKRRRRSMVLVVMVQTLEINTRGQGLVVRKEIASNLEMVVSKSSTMSGTCTVTRGSVPCCFCLKSIFRSFCIACNPSLSSEDYKRATSWTSSTTS
jgi:hypothetical protein